MEDKQPLYTLILKATELQQRIELVYSSSGNDTVKWFLRNSMDYIEGLLNELRGAYMEAAEKKE